LVLLTVAVVERRQEVLRGLVDAEDSQIPDFVDSELAQDHPPSWHQYSCQSKTQEGVRKARVYIVLARR